MALGSILPHPEPPREGMPGLARQQQRGLGNHAEAVGLLGPAADEGLARAQALRCNTEAGLLGLMLLMRMGFIS